MPWITGAELVEIMEWVAPNIVFGVWASVGADKRYCIIFMGEKHIMEAKRFGIYDHKLTAKASRLLNGFTDSFPMPVSRFTENRLEDIAHVPRLDVLVSSDETGAGIVRDAPSGDLYVLNHLEYDAKLWRRNTSAIWNWGKPPPARALFS